jgi:crossover junction endodeoxyribonuclease RuvC
LADIHAGVCDLIKEHRPVALAIEDLYFGRNAHSAFAVGQARGVILLAAAQHGRPVREATPNEVKVAVAGYGAADKAQVQRMVQLVLGMAELPTPDDAADALAVAICIANQVGQAGRVGSSVLDRAAVAPIERGESAYDRAVREALAREKRAERSAS